MQQTTLIFPSGMPGSLSYLHEASVRGERVIGASSLVYDPSTKSYETWVRLPFVGDGTFDAELKCTLDQHKVGAVYCPHPVVWHYLHNALPALAPQVKLLGESPITTESSGHQELMRRVRSEGERRFALGKSYQTIGDRQRPIEIEMAALFKHAARIEGQTDELKIAALCEVALSVPAGDVIEIGSAWGRSAFVLAWLARRYEIGNLLCIDPWNLDQAEQKDALPLVHEVNKLINWDEMLETFIVNLLPYNAGHINLLRMTSDAAFSIYQTDDVVNSAAFGATRYEGKIALLHIDGNHDYAIARRDIEQWSRLLVPGGWMIVDDYQWSLGSGPQQAADEYLTAHAENIETAFVAGSALFIKT